MSRYTRAEGQLRPLLDLADTWEDALTTSGFDVVDLHTHLVFQSTIAITLTGDERVLRDAAFTLGLPDYRVTKFDHGDGTTSHMASFTDIPGVQYVTVAAVEVRSGDPR